MKDFFFSNVKGFRYERKFYIEDLSAEEVELMIKLHPAIFREIYHERSVNNIYFDSFNLHNYFDNINGIDRRLKVRIRWYGDLFGFIENPTLELKLKHNLHVGKLFYPLKPFILDNTFSINFIKSVFAESFLDEKIKLYLKDLDFSLLNCYRRKYFLSDDHHYRITVDNDIKACRLNPLANNFLHKTICRGVILELKYAKSSDVHVDEITNHFPFRMTRSSKYVAGIEKLIFGQR